MSSFGLSIKFSFKGIVSHFGLYAYYLSCRELDEKNPYHSHVCYLNMKLQPGDSYHNLVLRLKTVFIPTSLWFNVELQYVWGYLLAMCTDWGRWAEDIVWEHFAEQPATSDGCLPLTVCCLCREKTFICICSFFLSHCW